MPRGAARQDWIGPELGLAPRTVGRILRRHRLPYLHDCDPLTGQVIRASRSTGVRYEHDRPGALVHMDVKKLGRIPDGGGWRAHGRGSDQHRAADRAKSAGARAGYVYLHSAVDGFSRLAYTEHLSDETARTAVAFWARARVFFAAHGITRVTRVITDNGSCYRSKAFTQATSHAARHQRTKPFTPKHNGKVERYQRILAEELLYGRPFTSEAERARAVEVWNVHYNYHRPHTAAGNQPPAQRLGFGVTNAMRSNNKSTPTAPSSKATADRASTPLLPRAPSTRSGPMSTPAGFRKNLRSRVLT